MALTSYGGLSAAQRTFYDPLLLKRALPYLGLHKQGRWRVLNAHEGMVANWRVYGGTSVGSAGTGLPVATTALGEGITPTESSISVANVSATVAQYGNWIKYTDVLAEQGIDPVMVDFVSILGQNAGQTLHTLLVNGLSAGTNVQYASSATSRVTVAAGHKMVEAEIREAVRTLMASNVEPFDDGYFRGCIHPRTAYDIFGDTVFQNMNVYNGGSAAGGNSLVEGKIGALYGVKFMRPTTHAPIYAGAGSGGIDVYGSFIFGPEWFAEATLPEQEAGPPNAMTNLGVNVWHIPKSTPDRFDPLRQYGVMAWKCAYVPKVIQEFRGVRIEHAVS